MKKLINLSNQQSEKIERDALEKGISFTEMVRRIIDRYYDDKNLPVLVSWANPNFDSLTKSETKFYSTDSSRN